ADQREGVDVERLEAAAYHAGLEARLGGRAAFALARMAALDEVEEVGGLLRREAEALGDLGGLGARQAARAFQHLAELRRRDVEVAREGTQRVRRVCGAALFVLPLQDVAVVEPHWGGSSSPRPG